MKISQLKEVIRTKVREATAVKVTGGAALTDPQISQKITQMRTTTGDQTIGTEKNPIKFVKENDKIKPGQVDTKTLFNVKLKNGTIYKNVRFHMLNDPKSFVTSDGGYRINQDIQSVVNANQELKETEEAIKPGEYTVARLQKMGRSGLIDFLGLTREEARNWSDRQLQGAALEMADDRSDYEETVDEADYIDDDDTVHEGVDDDNTDFKDYDSIYEDDSPDELKKSDALAKKINKAMMQIDDSMSYTDFALAVAKILADEYGTHNFKPFMSILSKKLMS